MADFPINPFDKLTPPANFPVLAQGYIQPATPDDIAMDDTGVTGPNLHRRIDMDNCEVMPQEVQPDQYGIFVAGKILIDPQSIQFMMKILLRQRCHKLWKTQIHWI